MKFKLVIVGDTNDGDYTTIISDITKEKLLRMVPVIEAIRNFKPYEVKHKSGRMLTHTHNWPNGEYSREDLGEKTIEEIYSDINPDLLEEFQEFVPYGINYIDSITMYEVAREVDLL